MQNNYKLQNIVSNIIERVKKQDFLVYFRKISIVELTEAKITFWVVSSFMKDNLEAKFYKEVFESAKIENPSITEIEFKVDLNIDNPSNTAVIDCGSFYKEDVKTKKTKATFGWTWENKVIKTDKCVNDRYSLSNFMASHISIKSV